MILIDYVAKIKAASAFYWPKLKLYEVNITITGTFFMSANRSSLAATMVGLLGAYRQFRVLSVCLIRL